MNGPPSAREYRQKGHAADAKGRGADPQGVRYMVHGGQPHDQEAYHDPSGAQGW